MYNQSLLISPLWSATIYREVFAASHLLCVFVLYVSLCFIRPYHGFLWWDDRMMRMS